MANPWEMDWGASTGKAPWEQDWGGTPQAAPAPPAQTDYRGEGMGAGTGLEAALIGARQGVTLGFGDEINAGVRAVGDMLGGKPFGESYGARLEHERGLLDQTRRENPVSEAVGGVGGAVLPALLTGGTMGLPAAAATGAGSAATYAFGEGEGGAGERTKDALKAAPVGALFGVGAGVGAKIGTKVFQKLSGRAAQRPSLESLRTAKNAAYQAVDDAGEVFQPAELQAMATKAADAVDATGSYVADVDKQTAAALTILNRNAKGPLTLGQLDKIRQGLWKRAAAAPNEVGILDAIDAIDDLVQSRGATNDLMQAARGANAQYKKAELLELAFKKAEDQTAATGSGGNILNKYKQAVASIVNDPKRNRWFNKEELATMQRMIDGSLPENALRRIGKISPGGNGLMLFLNLLGNASLGPGFLGVTAAGVGAKETADAMGRANVGALMDQVAGAAKPAPVRIPTAVPAASGYLAGR